jgi:hypothetical protein
MLKVLNATDVRNNWGQFIDDIVRKRPCLVKRSRDKIAAISIGHLEEILKSYRFTLEYVQEGDSSYSGSLVEIDLVANAASLAELIDLLVKDLQDYAAEYMDDYELYHRSLNRSTHFPYILHVLIRSSKEAVRELIDAQVV